MYDEAIKVSSTWKNGKNNYIPFMEYFINMILSCYTELDSHFPKINTSKLSTIEQIENIISESPAPISKKKIAELLPHISITTIEKYLWDLVKSGKIEKVGKARKTKYIKR